MSNAEYYTKRDGTLYTDYTKEEIKQFINAEDPATFIPFLQALDLPYIEHQWDIVFGQVKKYSLPLELTFPRYVTRMQLCSFRPSTFEDSWRWNKEYKCGIYRARKKASEKLLCLFKDSQAITMINQTTQEQDLERFTEMLQSLVGEDPNRWS